MKLKISRYIVYLLLSTINIEVFAFNELSISSLKNPISSTFYSRDERLTNIAIILILSFTGGYEFYY